MACCHPTSMTVKILGAVSVYHATSMYLASMCSSVPLIYRNGEEKSSVSLLLFYRALVINDLLNAQHYGSHPENRLQASDAANWVFSFRYRVSASVVILIHSAAQSEMNLRKDYIKNMDLQVILAEMKAGNISHLMCIVPSIKAGV